MYGVVRFAEAAKARRVPHGLRRGAVARADSSRRAATPTPRASTCSCWPATPRATAGCAAQISAAQLAAAPRARPVYDADELAERARRPLAGADRLPQGRGARPRWLAAAAPGRTPAAERSTSWSAGSAGTTWQSSCGTTATRSTTPATTRWPSWPRAAGCGTVATDNAHYAAPGRRRLATALAAVRARRSLDEMDGWLPAAGGRAPALRRGDGGAGSPASPAPCSGPPSSARACAFDLHLVAPSLPLLPVPGRTRRDELAARATAAGAAAPLRARRGRAGARGLRAARRTSWTMIEKLDFPGYFLIVWEIVEFCREQRHPLPGPGLGRELRGLLRARHHQRRPGDATGCCSSGSSRPSGTGRRTSTSTSRAAGARRSSSTSTSATAASTPPRSPTSSPTGRGRRCGTWPRRSATRRASRTPGRSRSTRWAPLEPTTVDHDIPEEVLELADRGEHFPRHLGIHSGGMVICDRPVAEVCPVEWARDGRPQRAAVGQGRLRRGRAGEVRPARARHARGAAHADGPDRASTTAGEVELATLPGRGRRRSTTCSARPTRSASSRSRAGPRWRPCPGCSPRKFYDLVVEVALIRPGPIQGGSVHPFIRRRNGHEPVTYAHPLLETALQRTLGRAAVPGAADADGDRRGRVHRPPRPTSCAGRWAPSGRTERMERAARRPLRGDGRATGIVGDGGRRDLREARGVRQLRLPREPLDAASPTWCTRRRGSSSYYPAAFCAALLDAQPMGFYSPQTLVADARRHGVVVRGPDLNASAARPDAGARGPSGEPPVASVAATGATWWWRPGSRSGSGWPRSGRSDRRGRADRGRPALPATWPTWCAGPS